MVAELTPHWHTHGYKCGWCAVIRPKPLTEILGHGTCTVCETHLRTTFTYCVSHKHVLAACLQILENMAHPVAISYAADMICQHLDALENKNE